MGLKYGKIIKNPAQILSLTGLAAGEFNLLAEEFKQEWDEYIMLGISERVTIHRP